ncbi:hypothetical protein BB427_17460 [Pseudoalteromonas sp. BMB]|nr:hypothetical protein BB427_17460 [Pseudoalteromonas sp. BMB]
MNSREVELADWDVGIIGISLAQLVAIGVFMQARWPAFFFPKFAIYALYQLPSATQLVKLKAHVPDLM